MKDEHIKSKGSILMPVLAGGIIGAGIALLLAPKSGAEIRKDLKQFASSTGGQIVSAVDKGKDVYEASKDALTAAMESGNIEYFERKEKFEYAV